MRKMRYVQLFESFNSDSFLLKESVDMDKFKEYMEKLARDFGFELKTGEIITPATFAGIVKEDPEKFLGEYSKENLGRRLSSKMDRNSGGAYKKNGLIYVGMYTLGDYQENRVIVGSPDKALIKKIQENFIENYSRFTSGEGSKKMEAAKSATLPIKDSDEGKLFFDFVDGLIDESPEIAGAGLDLNLNGVKDYIKNRGMEGKKMYVGLIPRAKGNYGHRLDRVMMAYNDEKVYKEFVEKIFAKFNKISENDTTTITVKDNEDNDVKITTFSIGLHNLTKKNVAQGSQGTLAVSKAYAETNRSSIEKVTTKDGVVFYYTGEPIFVA